VLVAAAHAIASTVSEEELNANYIIPSVFDPAATEAVAHAVADQARAEPGATAQVRDEDDATS
jgi:malate dehydrogenase (oxaloacetate-decarboxylating)